MAAGVSLASPWVALKLAPRPATAEAVTGHRRPVVIIHRTIRRVVIDPAAPVAGSVSSGGAPLIHYVYVGGGTVTTGGGSAGTTRCSGC